MSVCGAPDPFGWGRTCTQDAGHEPPDQHSDDDAQWGTTTPGPGGSISASSGFCRTPPITTEIGPTLAVLFDLIEEAEALDAILENDRGSGNWVEPEAVTAAREHLVDEGLPYWKCTACDRTYADHTDGRLHAFVRPGKDPT